MQTEGAMSRPILHFVLAVLACFAAMAFAFLGWFVSVENPHSLYGWGLGLGFGGLALASIYEALVLVHRASRNSSSDRATPRERSASHEKS
jgi:hypothetical protein